MFIVFALQNTCSSMLHAAYISNLFCSHFCFRQFGQSLLLNWLGQSKSLEYSTCFSSVSHTVQFSWSFPKNSIIFFFFKFDAQWNATAWKNESNEIICWIIVGNSFTKEYLWHLIPCVIGWFSKMLRFLSISTVS